MRAKHAERSSVAFAATLSTIALTLPIPMASAAIEASVVILNPSEQGAVISAAPTGSEDDPDAGDETYRLNAGVKNAPSNAIVEFELEGGSENIAIGTAKKVADGTFEYVWDPSNVDSGGYILRALLYTGTEQIAVAERDVEVVGADTPVPAISATADISYPRNGSEAGFYTNEKLETTSLVVDVQYSAGADSVGAYYTLSAVGDEPEWKRCGVRGVSTLPVGSSGETNVECELAEGDGGESITGVAAVANLGPTPAPFVEALNRSGDAVRVFPYVQDASHVLVDSSMRTVPGNEGEPPFGCSEEISIAVLDQKGRTIPNAPIDAHASGPNDGLKFAGTLGPNGNAPDEGHGENEEAAHDCAPGGFVAGTQGDHNRPGGADRKHLESTTDAVGSWTVQLWSDQPGSTALTVWADEDDNDKFCASEPAVAASIGWGQKPAGPTRESPEESSCAPPPPPQPDPSPSPSSQGCTIEGTAGDDKLKGTSGDDTICGLGGNDRIKGRGGDDLIKGGTGRDKLGGGPGSDELRGGPGRDSLNGGGGDDLCVGGAGRDRMRRC